MFRRFILTSSLLALTLTTATAAWAQAPAQPATNVAEVQSIVKAYLLNNPEVVVDALDAYRAKQEKEAAAKTENAIKDNAKALFEDTSVPSAGAKNADVVIVEFFDYHCGYCKHMLPVITQLLKDDPKLRVVFHELPILSEDSTMAAKAALAVHSIKPDKYFAYHTALMGVKGQFTEALLLAEAIKLGITEKQFKAAIANPAIQAGLDKSKALAESLGVSGTPAFVVGNEFIGGAESLEAMRERIAKQRAAKTPAAAPASGQ